MSKRFFLQLLILFLSISLFGCINSKKLIKKINKDVKENLKSWDIYLKPVDDQEVLMHTPPFIQSAFDSDFKDLVFLSGGYIIDDNFFSLSTWMGFWVNADWNYSYLQTSKIKKEILHDVVLDYFMDGVYWSDNDYYYLYQNYTLPNNEIIAINKGILPNFKILGTFWWQVVENPIGYIQGFLVIPPYKFSVDQETFKWYPQKLRDEEQKKEWYKRLNYLKWQGISFCQNWNKNYHKCIWSDKQWVYRWVNTPKGNVLLREKKQSDFKLIPPNEISGFFCGYKNNYCEKITDNIVDIRWMQVLIERIWNGIGVYLYGNNLYIDRANFWVWSVPVDWGTIQREEKDNNYFLFDRHYYYYLIHHVERDAYELQRTKK